MEVSFPGHRAGLEGEDWAGGSKRDRPTTAPLPRTLDKYEGKGRLLCGSGEKGVLSRHGLDPRSPIPHQLSPSFSLFAGTHSAHKNLILHLVLPKQCFLGVAEDGQRHLDSPVPDLLLSWT